MSAALLADKPWESPRLRDIASTADGKLYRRLIRFETTEGKVLAGPTVTGYMVAYQNQHGNEAKCYCTSWFDWRRKAARAGGRYRRWEEQQ